MHPSTKSKPTSGRRTCPPLRAWIWLLAIPALAAPVFGATFAARISPPNFELKARPGDVLRKVITITNADSAPAHYRIRTADWHLTERGGVRIEPAQKPLSAGSCRPWTRIERRSLKLQPKATRRYRFEVHVPQDASDGECRFAVVVSPAPDTVDPLEFGNLQFPIAGAIAVIVYVTIGEARPDLTFLGAFQSPPDQGATPVIRLHNRGTAHARPFGSLVATDAGGRKAELLVVPFPILPGSTRDIALAIDPEISGIKDYGALEFPLALKGKIEWDGGTCRIDSVLGP